MPPAHHFRADKFPEDPAQWVFVDSYQVGAEVYTETAGVESKLRPAYQRAGGGIFLSPQRPTFRGYFRRVHVYGLSPGLLRASQSIIANEHTLSTLRFAEHKFDHSFPSQF